MALYFIQDTTLKGIADAIRSKTGSEDGIAVTDMAKQISEIETGGASVSVETETLLEETTLSFTFDSDLGKYVHTITDPSFILEVDKTYIVTIDGKEYVRTAKETTIDSDSVIYFGDGRSISTNLGYTGEKFCVWYNVSENTINIIPTTDGESHIICIRKIIESDNSGGGTASLVVKTGSFKSTGEDVVTHGMGTVPLLIVTYMQNAASLSNGISDCCTAVSPIFLGSVTSEMFAVTAAAGRFTTNPYDFTQDYDTSHDAGFKGCIRAVNTQTFKVGSSDGIPTASGKTYYWIAIGYAPA